jgi:hypothetical protein
VVREEVREEKAVRSALVEIKNKNKIKIKRREGGEG